MIPVKTADTAADDRVERAARHASGAFIAVGVCLAAVQLLRNRSLWLDEAMLGLNLLRRDFAGLLEPLDYAQVAPVGFLLVEKAAITILGANEIVLRVFPFFCFLASLPLLYAFSRKLTGDTTCALLSAASFAVTLAAIDYATEVKQYMVETALALFVPTLAMHVDVRRPRDTVLLAAAGAASVFMSHAAVMIAVPTGAWLAWRAVRERSTSRVAMVFAAWAVGFAAYYWLFVHDHPTRTEMDQMWSASFAPANLASRSFTTFANQSIGDVWRQLFGFSSYWRAAELLSLVGLLVAVLRRETRLLLFVTGPLLVHLGLSAARLYPFAHRFLLYAVPLFIMLTCIGILAPARFLRDRLRDSRVAALTGLLLLLPLAAMLPPLAEHYPLKKEEIKQSIARLDEAADRDPVYVYHAALPAFTFYRESGLAGSDRPVIPGNEHRDRVSEYQTEMDALNRSVWLLFSHPLRARGQIDEEAYLVDYLLQRGGRLLETSHFEGSSLYHVETGR